MNRRLPTTILLLVCGLLMAALPAQRRVPLDGVWQIRAEDAPDESFRSILVPGAFETVLGDDFDGVARYRRTLPEFERVRKVFVEFAAVATHAEVFVNGKRCGSHLGGWTPFRVELTRHLVKDGDNVLDVVVDERVGHNTQGFLPVIQPHFGGIWQSVTLCLHDVPTIDRQDLFVFGNADGDVTVNSRIVAPHDRRQRIDGLRIDVFDGNRRVATQTRTDFRRFAEPLRIERPRLWSAADPHRYRAELTLTVDGREVDRVVRHFGCRELRADGTRVLWNGQPFQMRGILHWGLSPPQLAPPTDPAHWRPQLEYFQSLGFNTIKCCLWVPPTSFYELCDELGMLVWQEYPTWHAKLDQHHKSDLLREYHEFFVHDRSHPSVAFRSITCETGHGADLDVVTSLFRACKAAVPDTLVVDDSSWIGWQRVTDFWDEHPYGNNSWLPGRIEEFERHIEQHGAKPLLLGECIAADTWVDRDAWLRAHGTQANWWRPLCWDAQAEAEQWLLREFGQQTLDSLQPTALRFGNRNRKFQIEQLRMRMPAAGYVVSVARDFPKARMGFYDDLDRPKFSAAQWAWHRDTMICLDRFAKKKEHLAPGTRRPGRTAPLRVVVSHFGAAPLRGELVVRDGRGYELLRTPVTVEPGSNSAPFDLIEPGGSDGTGMATLHAELTGTHPSTNTWSVPVAPGSPTAVDIASYPGFSAEMLDRLQAGETAVMNCHEGSPNEPRTSMLWMLRGAPFAPPHPIHEVVSKELLLDIAAHGDGLVMPWEPWRDEVDPILGFWDTHDIAEVRFWLFAFTTRVGKGRLMVTTLQPDAAIYARMCEQFADGPAPKRALSDASIAALRARLAELTIELPTWRFRTDPDDTGRGAGWHDPATDVATAEWRDLQAGSHWENQGDDLAHYTGVAWYRCDVDVPTTWQGIDARAVFDGVDDSFDVWLNGEHLGTFGDEHEQVTIWLEQQVQELGRKLRAGQRNTLVLRVVDHAGAGGLWKGVRLTTGPVGVRAGLLR